uniref:Uncharacterized protein n=1 Tax=Oryza glaberrima TaxID=4538 RepID=I1Q1H8_ORYGL
MGMPSVQAVLRCLPPQIRPHCATANPATLRCFLPLISPSRPPQPCAKVYVEEAKHVLNARHLILTSIRAPPPHALTREHSDGLARSMTAFSVTGVIISRFAQRTRRLSYPLRQLRALHAKTSRLHLLVGAPDLVPLRFATSLFLPPRT